MPHRSGVVFTRNILGQQHGVDAQRLPGPGGVAPQDLRPDVRRADRPDIEHLAALRRVVHIHRATGHMAHGALMVQVPGGIGHGPAAVDGEAEIRVLRLALLTRDKFLPQADDQAAPVVRAAPRIIDGLVGGVQQVRHRRVAEFFPHQRLFRLARPQGHRRHPAVGNPRLADQAGLIDIDAERRRHDTDVELAAFGDFGKIHPPRQPALRTAAGEHDLAHDLAGLQHGLAVGGEEVCQRHRALAPGRDQHDAGIEGQQHRGAVADRRSGDEIAAQRGPVADLAGGKDAQHLCDRGEFATERLLDIGQRGARADMPGLGRRSDAGQLRHALGRDEQREGLEFLVQLDPDLGRTGDELGRRIGFEQSKQAGQRCGPEEFRLADGIVQRGGRARRHPQARRKLIGVEPGLRTGFERVRRPRSTFALLKRRDCGVPNRPVAGATAKIAAQLVADLPRLCAAIAVIGFKHRDDKTGCAVAALGAVVLDHCGLHRMQLFPVGATLREALNGHDLTAGEHRHQGDAAVEGAIGGLAVRVAIHQRHRARAAVAFRAAFLGAGQAIGPQPRQQRGGGRDTRRGDRAAVDDEVEAGRGRRVRWPDG